LAYKNICGFELGDSSVCDATAGTVTFEFDSGNQRSGYGCAYVDGTLGGNNYLTLTTYTQNIGIPRELAITNLHVGVAVKIPAAPSGTVQMIVGRNPTHVTGNIRMNSDRTLSVYTGNTSVATGSTVLAINTWYYVEFKTVASAIGAYELKINGTTELSGTANFVAVDYSAVTFGNYTLTFNAYRFYFDDIYINDSEFAPAVPGIDLLYVSANGTYTSWVGNRLMVDEFPPDGDTSKSFSSTATTVETYGFSYDFDHTGCAVAALKHLCVVRVYSGGTPAFKYISRIGTTDDLTDTNDNPGSDYKTRCRLWETNWDTLAPLTLANVTEAEAGVYDNSTGAHMLYCTSVSGEFLYYIPSVTRAKYTPHAGI